jgi:hypothetical protein
MPPYGECPMTFINDIMMAKKKVSKHFNSKLLFI